MQNWNRRNVLQALGLSSLGLQFSLHRISSNNVGEIIWDEKVKRLLYNENPYGPPEATKKLIVENIGRSNRYCTFHKYDLAALKELIATQEGLKPENILLGHGSFELLTWLAVHYTEVGGEIIVPSPTFDVVGRVSKNIGGKVQPIEVNSKFKIDLVRMEAQVSAKTKLLTLCNPNNPTGKSMDTESMKSFCRMVSKKCPVLIDEAYIHYLANWRKQTMAPLINEGSEVLVSRTFSKIYGMAGLRIGFLMGPANIISELEKKFTLGFPGNMPNSLSVAAAMGALESHDFVLDSRKKNTDGRKRLYEALKELELPYLESTANFVYFDVKNFKSFKSYMRKYNIILAGGWPTKPNWARVTIGTEDEMTYFMSKLKGKEWL